MEYEEIKMICAFIVCAFLIMLTSLGFIGLLLYTANLSEESIMKTCTKRFDEAVHINKILDKSQDLLILKGKK